MKSINDIIKNGLCIGCGICTYDSHIKNTVYSEKHGQFLPNLQKQNERDSLAFALCPGKGYSIVEDAKSLFPESHYDLELGRYFNYYAAVTKDRLVLKNASSGGIISQISIFLLENKIVDRILTTIFTYTDNGPLTKCILAKTKQEILLSQGSKYCPVDLSEAIMQIKKADHRIAIIGTPCHIAGVRNIQKLDQSFKNKVVLTISNFCGGFKNYRNIELLANRNGVDIKDITFFRFRGGGQPGSMLIETKSGAKVKAVYPSYVGLTGISKHLRCHLCVDATAELADIACGDAWLGRFLEDKSPWSIVITRSKRADDLIQNLINLDIVTAQSITLDEIKISQRENLFSKKVRQKSRFYFYRKLGYVLPKFDGGYFENSIYLTLEIKIFLKHNLKNLLEVLNLFNPAYTLYKKIKNI